MDRHNEREMEKQQIANVVKFDSVQDISLPLLNFHKLMDLAS